MKRLFCLYVCSVALHAAGTATWEMNNYQDFIRGRFEGVSLTRDGRLTMAPALDTVFASDQPVVWNVAQGPDGSLYAATGHRGRIFRIDSSGKASLVFTAPEPEIFALAVDAKGALYAGSSPDGKVYRIENGKSTEYFAPGAKYIWSLAVAADGALFIGTGDGGKVFRVTAPGVGEVWYETGQAHITSLAIDGQSRLLAGTEPNGILYRVTAKDKAFVLYDANLPEIRAIVPQPDGTVYAAALGGSVAKRSQSAAQSAAGSGGAPVTAPTMSITVTADAAAQAGVEIKPPADQAKQQQAAQTSAVSTQFTPVVDMTGVEKSAVYRINADNTVETLWSSKDENAYDLLVRAGQILFSTDGSGRVYRLSPDRKLALVAQTNEGEATRLFADKTAVLAATSNMGKIYRLGDRAGSAGSYESPVHDAGTIARWGRIEWRGEGAGLTLRTRSGNSLRPDRTWSDWSGPMSAAAAVGSPNARYIQWKAEFSGSPELDSVTLAYLPQNSPPSVKSVTVLTQLVAATALNTKAAAQQASAGVYTITVSDTGDAPAAASSGTPTQLLPKTTETQIQITWQADDPDGDRLVYALEFRGEDEREWKRLKRDLRENTFVVDAAALADGRYLFRVTASDREVNPPESARESELISSPVLMDNTPPVVTVGTPRRSGGLIELDVEAVDGASALRRCEFSMDASGWIPVSSEDGVIDGLRETFRVRVANVSPGEHVIVVRAVDSANNVGLKKTVVR